MPSFNQVLLMGNVTRDPQLKALPNGSQVVDFGLAVNRKYRSAAGEDKEETCFVDCAAFGKQAEVIHQYCQKGKPLFLEGVVHGEAALSGAVARRLLERVRTGSDQIGGVPDTIAQKLSARELEVLLLLDEHLTTDEIAKRLYISEHTVRSHVKSLLRKLGVSSRREALERLSLARAA